MKRQLQTLNVLLGVGAVWLAALPANTFGQAVKYELTFDAVWSKDTHPEDFPSNPHFSGLVGGTHNDQVAFWKVGELASPGIEAMAELGQKTLLIAEVRAAINDGTAAAVISGPGIFPSPGQAAVGFSIGAAHPRVTVVAMIAPTPDWFIGVSGLSLRKEGEWLERVVVVLYPYDSGTDSGTRYRSSNEDTDPPEKIADIRDRYPFQGAPPLGTFTFRLISRRGDLDCDGSINLVDVAPFITALLNPGEYENQYPDCDINNADANEDGSIDLSDVEAFIELLLG